MRLARYLVTSKPNSFGSDCGTAIRLDDNSSGGRDWRKWIFSPANDIMSFEKGPHGREGEREGERAAIVSRSAALSIRANAHAPGSPSRGGMS